MDPGRLIYNLLLPGAHAFVHLASPFSDKIADGLEGRKGWKMRWALKTSGLKTDKLLAWFHVSSVGEFLQAKPVMDILSKRHGAELDIALTFFSPSGLNYFEKHDPSMRNKSIRFVDYLPVDTIRNARFCLEALSPDIIVYVKFDLWPNLIYEASELETPQILISGTLSPNSSRLSRLGKRFYGDLYSKLTVIAAISDEDASRFRSSARHGCEVITAGDTRFDQVCRRIDTMGAELPQPLAEERRPFIIAGSTWPRDEAVVIPGFRRLRTRFPDCLLILVPHEPTAGRLDDIRRSLKREDLTFSFLSKLESRNAIEAPVVVADGLGYLAELYRIGLLAYVGGSFTTGVHNVMEPAVLGLPVLFGPRIENSLEARQLVELGAGAVVNSPTEFESKASALLSDRDTLREKGGKGREFIRNHCGAAEHCVDLIDMHLGS
jgi:3-deoxy-D-manno-octulosonic-acid transferase